MFFYTKNTYKLCEFNTEDKICEAALTLFSQQGFFNTSIHHIQKEAQVSIGSIYYHFDNKQDIAQTLQTKILEQMDMAFIDVLNQHNLFHEKYFHIIKLLFTMTEIEFRPMKFIFHSKYSEYSNLNKSIFQTKPFKSINREVANNCNSDIIKRLSHSIDLMMATLFSLPIQLIQLRLDGIVKTQLTEQTDIVFKTIWDGLCKQQIINSPVESHGPVKTPALKVDAV